MKLFEKKQVKKFFDILSKMDRGYSIDERKQIYKGYDKNNPDIVKCQKEVFVNRTVNKWLKDKFLKLYKEDEYTNIEYIQYLSISRIEYNLGWGDVLKISILDYINPHDFFNYLKLSYNDIIDLEGEWTDDKIHKQLYDLIKLNIPEKKYTFKAYDWSLYPKRKTKNWTTDKLIVDFVISAKTEKEALKKANQYCEENKLMLKP